MPWIPCVNEAQKDYKKKRKKSIKKLPIFTEDQLYFIKIRFNKYHDTPEQLIYLYFLEFGVKFPACVKTLYKWIRLGEFGLKKENLPHRGKKYKTKGKPDNRGQLTNFKSIWNIENKVSNVGLFEMDTVVGKDHQSACLTFTEEKSLYTICFKLDHHNSEEVNKTIKSIFKNKLYKENIKGIITDRGKEFSNWKGIEKITGTNVYFCDPCSPKQKPKVERMNRDIREYLIKGKDFNNITQKEINKVMKIINEKPRQSLGWLSSKEVFLQNI